VEKERVWKRRRGRKRRKGEGDGEVDAEGNPRRFFLLVVTRSFYEAAKICCPRSAELFPRESVFFFVKRRNPHLCCRARYEC